MATKTEKKYIETIGRRKTATARVRITPGGSGAFSINDRKPEVYLPTAELLKTIHEPFSKGKVEEKFDVSVRVSGSGISAQAEAIRHGISRALVAFNAELRGSLKKEGFLKRDPRVKERRKAGNAQKARKKKQWSKR